ncbi:MAG: nucleoside 2-deoxyribosyltransferase domain-containing protein [Spirochaetaceae bacterium]
MKIYFAGPLFCKSERDFNLNLTIELEKLGYEVFLPQRDGAEKDKPPYDSMPKDERRLAIFSLDRNKILECDIFLFVLDGRVPDEGACVELGIAYTQKYLTNADKLLIGLQTDIRAAFLGSRLNPMIKVPLDQIIEDVESLLTYLSIAIK